MTLDEAPIVHWRDGLEIIAGDLIGAGMSRRVYAAAFDPARLVVKWQQDRDHFQNQREWIVWMAIKEVKKLAAWFAPCESISPAGLWLVQRRTQPVSIEELRREIPKVPMCFTDLHVGNWGRLDGRIVCHDYGFALTTEYGITGRMKKAEWR